MASAFQTALKSVGETGKHALIYGVTNALSSAIGIILIPLYTRYLLPEEYGILSILTITMTFAFSVFSLGMNSSVFRFYYEDDIEKRVLVGTSTVLMGLSAFALGLLGTVISMPLSVLLFGTDKYGLYFILMFVAYSIALLKGIPFLVLRAEKQPTRFAVYNTANFLFQVSLIVILVAYYRFGIYGVVLGTLMTNIIFAVITFVAIKDHITFTFSQKDARAMLRFGVPLVFLSISNLVLTYFDQYLINFYRSLQEVALYNLGYRVGMIIYILLIVPFYTAWAPMKYSIRKEPHAREYYSMVLNYFTLAGLWFVVAISAVAYDLLKIVATPIYYGAATVVPIIVASYFIYGLSWPIDLGVSFAKKTEYYAYITAFGAALNIVLNIIIIPIYGYIGAALTTLATYSVMLVIRYYVNQSLYPIRYDWHKISVMVLVAVALCIVGYLPRIDSLLQSLGYRALIIIAYPVILYLVGVVTKDEAKWFINAVKGRMSKR